MKQRYCLFASPTEAKESLDQLTSWFQFARDLLRRLDLESVAETDGVSAFSSAGNSSNLKTIMIHESAEAILA